MRLSDRLTVKMVVILLTAAAAHGGGRALKFKPLISAQDRQSSHVVAASVHAPHDFVDGQWQGIIAASDGCTYFSLASHLPNRNAQFYKYDPQTRRITHIINVAAWADEREAIGKRNLQGKIHSEMFEADGKLYATTCAPHSRFPWKYSGGHFLSYDLKAGQCEHLAHYAKGSLLPLWHDPVLGRLYSVSDGVLLYYDMQTRQIQHAGRVYPKSSHSTRRPIGDKYGCVYGGDVEGKIWRYNPTTRRLDILKTRVPHNPAAPQPVKGKGKGYAATRWRNLRWDSQTKWWYGIHGYDEYLFRFRTPAPDSLEGEIEGLGAMGYADPKKTPRLSSLGLAILNGKVYYTPYSRQPGRQTHLVSYDISTGKIIDHGPLFTQDGRRVSEIHSLAASKTSGELHAAAMVWSHGRDDPTTPMGRDSSYIHCRLVVINPKTDLKE